MINTSFWELSQTKFDIVIIGAGFLGSWTAYELSKTTNLSIAVIERSSLSEGASTKNAGFACFGSATELLSEVQILGLKTAFEITNKRIAGINKLRTLLGDSLIQFDSCGGYEVFLENCTIPTEDTLNSLNMQFQRYCGVSPFTLLHKNEIQNLGFSENVLSAISNPYEGSIHPVEALKTLQNLNKKRGVKYFFDSEFISFDSENSALILKRNFIEMILQTNKIVYCTNAFTRNEEIAPGRGQVFVTNVINNLNLRGTFHYNEGFVYFRNIQTLEGNRILLGGGRDIDFATEETTSFLKNENIISYLENFLLEILPPQKNFTIEKTWTGIMGFSKNKLPIVKQLSKNEFLGFSCNGMGIALTPIISEEIAELVLKSN